MFVQGYSAFIAHQSPLFSLNLPDVGVMYVNGWLGSGL